MFPPDTDTAGCCPAGSLRYAHYQCAGFPPRRGLNISPSLQTALAGGSPDTGSSDLLSALPSARAQSLFGSRKSDHS
eukprot:758859-Hanusia_phi.AAC.1